MLNRGPDQDLTLHKTNLNRACVLQVQRLRDNLYHTAQDVAAMSQVGMAHTQHWQCSKMTALPSSPAHSPSVVWPVQAAPRCAQ